MSDLKLILPDRRHKEQVEEYKRVMLENNSEMDGCGSLGKDGFENWLKRCVLFRKGKNLPDGYVPATQYIAVRKSDGKIVGMLQIRHTLSDYLFRVGGHIGYSVAVDERRKGYATEMLRIGLKKCKRLGIEDKVLVTCINTNTASEKCIRNNGGVFENEVEHNCAEHNEIEIIKRFWIKI